jgi:peptidyl-prolyl cis-trans isomerase A (cyclophilin A)
MRRLLLVLVGLLVICTSFASADDGIFAIVKTEKGEITIRLHYDKAPMTVANFIGLAEGSIENSAKEKGAPFYDGLNFHRVEAGAIIQGGCPLGNGLGNPGYKFKNETPKSLNHDKAGVVAMANSGNNTNGSQFYITMRPIPSLDGDYSVFGQVEKGLGVIEMISLGDKIINVRIERKGDLAKAFEINTAFPKKARKKL